MGPKIIGSFLELTSLFHPPTFSGDQWSLIKIPLSLSLSLCLITLIRSAALWCFACCLCRSLFLYGLSSIRCPSPPSCPPQIWPPALSDAFSGCWSLLRHRSGRPLQRLPDLFPLPVLPLGFVRRKAIWAADGTTRGANSAGFWKEFFPGKIQKTKNSFLKGERYVIWLEFRIKKAGIW